MKKIFSILISIVILLSAFSFVMPSFALTSGAYTYEIIDEKIVITGYNGTDAEITVPATIDDIPVVKIGDGAFKDNITLKSVTVSSGVQDIGTSAFENCTSLATISLPDTIIHIGEKAIYNTAYYNDESNWKLKRTQSSGGINIGNGMDTISWEDIAAPLLQYLYLGKNLIEIEFSGSYTVKNGTLVIADGAAVGSVEANEIALPDSIVAIGCGAFEGCVTLKNVKNLNSVAYIGDSAFEGCTSLKNFEISDSAIFHASSIYNTGYYNNKKNWKNGTLYMGTRVVGTDKTQGETYIEDGAISIIGGALGEKDAVIPASVTEINDKAFINTENVRIFGYSGTYAQTYAIEKNIPFVDLECLTKGDVDFNGVVNDNDFKILCAVSSTLTYEGYAISIAGDMNEDGAVDGLDAVILDLFLKGLGPSTLKGDADGDGEITEADYDLLIEISMCRAEITDNFMFDRCDLNGDGAVDSFDAIYLDLVLSGLVALV